MSPPVAIEDANKWVAERYVGFQPNTGRIKPVHVANGLFRQALGKKFCTKGLINILLCKDTQNVYSECRTNEYITDEMPLDQFEELRTTLRSIVSVDDGVYEDGMDSHSAANQVFVSNDRVGQESGQFIAAWLKKYEPDLLRILIKSLEDPQDEITRIFVPILPKDEEVHISRYSLPEENLLLNGGNTSGAADTLIGEFKCAGHTLAKNLEGSESTLYSVRLIVRYACLQVIRHMANLERFYLEEELEPQPLLLMFADNPGIKLVSKNTYSAACQAMSRFYAFAYGKYLEDKLLLEPDELLELQPPTLRGKLRPGGEDIWKDAISYRDDFNDPYSALGNSMFELVTSHRNYGPVEYFRTLGRKIGISQPKNQTHQWYKPKPEMMDLLLKCALVPGETVELHELIERLWRRFGFVIGARGGCIEALVRARAPFVTHEMLKENEGAFARSLVENGLARSLPDGVLMITTNELTGSQND